MENYDLFGAYRFQVPPSKNASKKAHVTVCRYIIPCAFVIVIIVILIMIVLVRKRKVKLVLDITFFPNQEV